MVMPEEGRIGRLSVIFGDGREELLEGAYSAIEIDDGRFRRYQGDDAQLQATFSQVIQSLPKEPMSTTLYFVRGKDDLTMESQVEAARIHRIFVDRQSQEVWIIGHTDTVGGDAFNEALSIRRAERVKTMLISLGVPAESIVTKGMGKRAPRVPTADNTDEPRNRRVDISVR